MKCPHCMAGNARTAPAMQSCRVSANSPVPVPRVYTHAVCRGCIHIRYADGCTHVDYAGALRRLGAGQMPASMHACTRTASPSSCNTPGASFWTASAHLPLAASVACGTPLHTLFRV